MTDSKNISLGSLPPETVLPDPDPSLLADLAAAAEQPKEQRWAATAAVTERWPHVSLAWAELCDLTSDRVTAYAFARVGYHRGLDALRANGWRGSGYVRWQHRSNRGFLRCLDALRRLSEEIGEKEESARCGAFLKQLEPAWDAKEGENNTCSGA